MRIHLISLIISLYYVLCIKFAAVQIYNLRNFISVTLFSDHNYDVIFVRLLEYYLLIENNQRY